MSMVTVAMLRGYLDKVKAGTDVDADLTDALTRAEAIIVGAVGWSFFDDGDTWSSVSASQKIVRSERSRWLKLPPYLYGSITSVAPASGTGSDLSVGAAITDYDETESKFYLERESGWGGLRYAVTAKWGYGPAPDDVVELVLELAVNIWRQKAQGMFQQIVGVDKTGQSVGGGSIKYVGGLNDQQRKIVRTIRSRYVDVAY